MTYQVSYCIYTAATAEALELKRASASLNERKEAAIRLAAAVQILQNEANHTPGSGRSVNTIRRLLIEGDRQTARSQRSRGPQQDLRYAQRRREWQDSPSSDGCGDLRSQQRYQTVEHFNTTVDRTEDRVTAARQVHEMSRLDENAWRPSNSSGTHSPRVLRRGDAGDVSAMAPVEASPLVQQVPDYAASGPSANMGLFGVFWDDPAYVGATDTGAGFHPDSFSWGITDDFPPRLPQATHHHSQGMSGQASTGEMGYEWPAVQH
jgi:hypothetical protein